MLAQSAIQYWLPSAAELKLFGPDFALVGTIIVILIGSMIVGKRAGVCAWLALAGLVVAFVGLEANLDPADVTPDVSNTLGLTLGLAILVLVGLSIAAFSRYDLSRESHARVRAALDAGSARA